jgi:hypothetical protein
LEVFKGATYYTFDIEHVWPLYKRIVNSIWRENEEEK